MKVALGIGCDRGTPLATLARAVDEALAVAGLQRGQVTGVGSITLKADEPALLALAAQAGWPLHFYPATQLAEVVVPHPSETVRRHTGTPSVSEAAALLAAGTTEASALCVEKHRLRGGDGRNATVSVARVMPRTAIPPCVANPDPARRFTACEREAVLSLMQVRRDMRHFTTGAQVAEDVRARLQSALLAAPSVGLMQPLRVLRITDPVLRDRLAAAVDQERMRTAQALGPRAAEFLALKVEGLRECAELWALVLAPDNVVHRIQKNNYLGTNHGKVIGINLPRVSLERSFEYSGENKYVIYLVGEVAPAGSDHACAAGLGLIGIYFRNRVRHCKNDSIPVHGPDHLFCHDARR